MSPFHSLGSLGRARPIRLVLARLVLATAVPLASAHPAGAQSNGDPRLGDEPVDPTRVVDMRTLDPHDYRAVAVRLPEGLGPRIDGVLDDDAWQLAPAFGDFVQREPDVGHPSTHRTEFRVLYDDTHIYVAVWAFEPHEGGVIASEMARTSMLRKGDAVRITLDTFHDHRNLFYFSTNPLGAYKDGHSTDNGRMNWDWNAVWEVRTSTDDHGWYSEFAIPLSQLRFPDSSGEQVWGINVGRMITHNREEASFVPMPREWGAGAQNRAAGAGLLLGLEDLSSGRRLELVPFLAPGVTRDFDAGTPTTATSGFGGDLRMGLPFSLNADLTYRTDFGQVEADQEVVNLSRFSLFFPEKRQFFTEGDGTFGYGQSGAGGGGGAGLLSLFYSRRIGLNHDGREIPILGGARVTGTPGPYTLGLLNVQTDPTRYFVADTMVEVPRANYTVARLRRNVLSSSTLGIIALNRQGEVATSAYNRSVGFDGVFNLPNNVRIVSLLAKTFSPGIVDRDLAGVLSVDWAVDRFGLRGSYTDIQEDFNAEMGFVPRVDVRNTSVGASWTPRPSWPGVRQMSLDGRIDYYENHQGTVQSREQRLAISLMRNDGSNVRASITNDYDLLVVPFRVGPNTVAPGGYSSTTFAADFGTDDSRRVFGGGSAEVGEYFGGTRRTLRANLNFLAQETLLFENDYTRNHIALPDRPTHVTNTLNTRVSYSVSPTLFLKAFVQYNDDRSLANLNLMLWSIYRPGSDLYVVYNHGWETGIPGADRLRVRNRSLAVKLTYWLSR